MTKKELIRRANKEMVENKRKEEAYRKFCEITGIKDSLRFDKAFKGVANG